jgi:hypothetical protein
MATPHTWKCPGCGADIRLPDYCFAGDRSHSAERLGQVVQAACGCWIKKLPEGDFYRLLGAVAAGAGNFCHPKNRAGRPAF